MSFSLKILTIVLEIYILISQLQGSCVRFSQRNSEEFCEATESPHKIGNNASSVIGNDMRTTTLSNISTRSNENSTSNDYSSEYNLENKLINIAIESLLELRKMNLMHLSQSEAASGHKGRADNETAFILHGELKTIEGIIRKRSILEHKAMLPHLKQNSRKFKKSKHPKQKHRFFK